MHLDFAIEFDVPAIGELTEWDDSHSDLLKTNWIGFQLEQGRYRLCR